jgi:hypothetical protein
MSHFHILAGLRGYLPIYSVVFETLESTVEAATTVHDLSEEQAEELYRDLEIELDIHKHGNEYIQIFECDDLCLIE